MNRIFFLFFITLSFLSCQNDTKETRFKLGNSKQPVLNIDNYFSDIDKVIVNRKDTLKQYFVFANNPYSLDNSYGLIIYANNKCIYKGDFKESIQLPLNELLIKKNRNHFFFEILTPESSSKKSYLYRFNTKKTIVWKPDYKFVYVAFFPANDSEDKIFFFPQRHDLFL